MIRNTCSVFLLGIAFLVPAARGQATGDGPLSLEDYFAAREAYRAAPDDQSRASFALSLLSDAQQHESFGHSGIEQRYQLAGTYLYQAGQYDNALFAYQRAILSDSNPIGRVYAMRMVGQIQMKLQNWFGAELAYRDLTDALTADASLLASMPDEYVTGMLGRATALGFLERRDEAIAVRAAMIDSGIASNDRVWRAMRSNARDALKNNQPAESLLWWDRLFHEFPEVGLGSDSRLSMLLERARALDPSRSNSAYFDAVMAVWIDPANQSYLHVLDAGVELMRVAEQDYMIQLSVDIASDVIVVALANETAWTAQPDDAEWFAIDLHAAVAHVMLYAMDVGDYDRAYWAASIYTDRFDTPDNPIGASITARAAALLDQQHPAP